MTNRREDVRNIAIIAHVDHGKTTLVDEGTMPQTRFVLKSIRTRFKTRCSSK